MMWQLQLFAETTLAWVQSAPNLNLAFAVLSICTAYSPCPRRVAWASAGLYVLLAFC